MSDADLQTVAELKALGLWESRYFSAPGLIPLVQALGLGVKGLEIGACRGENAVKFLEQCPNIARLDMIDPYIEYTDVNGSSSQNTLNRSQQINAENIAPFGDRAKTYVCTSMEYVKQVPDGYYDYIFVDGNHSYSFVREDVFAWYPKLRSGGLFAGHDAHLADVSKAVQEFRQICNISAPIYSCPNSVWFWKKP